MSDILDLIDGAIWDHGDAMRWTPEPVEDEEAPADPWIELAVWDEVDIARIFDVPLELLAAERSVEVWAWETSSGTCPNLTIIDERHNWVVRP